MAKKISKITDSILNKVTGRNIETFEISLDEMVALVDEHYIQPAATPEDYDVILKTVKGGLFLDKKLISKDERYEMHVSTHRHTGIFNWKDKNYIWIHDKVEDKFYEYRAYFYGKFKKAVKAKISEANLSR